MVKIGQVKVEKFDQGNKKPCVKYMELQSFSLVNYDVIPE